MQENKVQVAPIECDLAELEAPRIISGLFGLMKPVVVGNNWIVEKKGQVKLNKTALHQPQPTPRHPDPPASFSFPFHPSSLGLFPHFSFASILFSSAFLRANRFGQCFFQSLRCFVTGIPFASGSRAN